MSQTLTETISGESQLVRGTYDADRIRDKIDEMSWLSQSLLASDETIFRFKKSQKKNMGKY